MIYYKQCLLINESNNTEYVVWLPEKYSQENKKLIIKRKEDKQGTRVTIRKVYNEIREKEDVLIRQERDYNKQRKASDV